MAKKILILFWISLLLFACRSQQQELMYSTPAYTNLSSTQTAYILPTSVPSATPQPTIAPEPPRKPTIILPGGLKMEEYITYNDPIFDTAVLKEMYKRHQNEIWQPANGVVINNRVDDFSEFSLNNSIDVLSKKINDEKWVVVVSVDGMDAYQIEVANLSGVSGLVRAWGYDNHWALEVIPYPSPVEASANVAADVILDGSSLREKNNFKAVFGFQLLAGKPFFFFRNDNGIGISYDGQNSVALYDNVLYRNWWIAYDPDPISFENMVMFRADNQGKQYVVLIGLFQK